MTSRYQIRFVDRVIVKGKLQPISLDEVLDPETEGAFQFCCYTPKKRFLQNRGASETQLVRELKLQTQADFKRRLEHDRRHEFKAAKTYFYSALHLNGVHPWHPPPSSGRVPDRAGGLNLLHSVEICCINFYHLCRKPHTIPVRLLVAGWIGGLT